MSTIRKKSNCITVVVIIRKPIAAFLFIIMVCPLFTNNGFSLLSIRCCCSSNSNSQSHKIAIAVVIAIAIILEEELVQSTAKSDNCRELKPFNWYIIGRTVSFHPKYIFELLKSIEKKRRSNHHPIVAIISETFFIEWQ